MLNIFKAYRYCYVREMFIVIIVKYWEDYLFSEQ